jgi:UDP-N-acetylmuramate dehydrogenase
MSDSRIHPVKRTANASLKRLNTFGIESNAQELIVLSSLDQLAELHQLLSTHPDLQDGKALHVLGGGSNLLIASNVDSLVLKIELSGVNWVSSVGSKLIIEAAAGESWHGLVRTCLKNGWNGLENLSLIPGTVGASPIQNIGAYGVELKDRFESLQAWNWRTNKLRTWYQDDCQFAYRDSVFKKPDGKDWLVLSVNFLLSSQTTVSTEYADLKTELTNRSIVPETATPMQVSDAVCAVRTRKLPDPAQLGNAGSFFQNPIISSTLAASLKEQYPAMPQWPVIAPTVASANRANRAANKAIAEATAELSGALTKISAAWLIDQCGWKGHREGDAGVHQHHALVLVNYATATGQQLKQLAQSIQVSVHKKFGIHLHPEPIQWPLPKQTA